MFQAFSDFFSAVENEMLFTYLKMDIPQQEVEFDRLNKLAGGVIESVAAPPAHAPPPPGGPQIPGEMAGTGPKPPSPGDAIRAEGSSDEDSDKEDNAQAEVGSETGSIGPETMEPEEKETRPVEKGGDQVKAEENESSSSEEDSSSEGSSSEEETDTEDRKDIKEPVEKGGDQVKAEQRESSSEESSSSSDDSSSSDSSSGEEE